MIIRGRSRFQRRAGRNRPIPIGGIVDNPVNTDATVSDVPPPVPRDEWQPQPRDYDDIPGTFVFDGRRSRRGYPLNMFLMSLNRAENREAFRTDEAAYLDRFPLDAEQREAVLNREWLRLLELGGNLYYTYKLAACDGLSFQDLAGEQTGMSSEDYARMMLDGGRPIEGNRSRAEWTQRAEPEDR
jgi:protocatechuate 4,5-dioxygenase alpha chain